MTCTNKVGKSVDVAHRLDVLIKARNWTNEEVADRVGCTVNYVSGIRNGQRPGLKLATTLCRLFRGELTLRDLGIEIDLDIAARSEGDGKDAA